MKTTKTTPQKILKTFLTAKAKSDIKPELQGVYIHEINKQKYLVVTDSFRLNILNYDILEGNKNYQLLEGIYNFDNLSILTGYTYPDYTIILHKDTLVDTLSIEDLQNKILQTPIADIKTNSIILWDKHYKKDYIDEAIAFMVEVSKRLDMSGTKTEIAIYTKQNAPLVICLQSRYKENVNAEKTVFAQTLLMDVRI